MTLGILFHNKQLISYIFFNKDIKKLQEVLKKYPIILKLVVYPRNFKKKEKSFHKNIMFHNVIILRKISKG